MSWLSEDASDEPDLLIMSPQVEDALLGGGTPIEVIGALSTGMVALRDALDTGILPLDAMPVPGIPGAFLIPLPRDLGMLEFHETTVDARLAFYLARVIRTDSYPDQF